jgi:hypothetical protein
MGAHGSLFLDPWLPDEVARAVALLFEYGLAPFVALYTLTFEYGHFPAHGAAADRFLAAFAGSACYAAAAWGLWHIVRRVFRAQANRDPSPGRPRE